MCQQVAILTWTRSKLIAVIADTDLDERLGCPALFALRISQPFRPLPGQGIDAMLVGPFRIWTEILNGGRKQRMIQGNGTEQALIGPIDLEIQGADSRIA